MKINIGIERGLIDGYKNIDFPVQDGQIDGVEYGDITNLENFNIADNSVNTIRSIYTLNKIPFDYTGQILHNWTQKLEQGGELIIQLYYGKIIGHAIAFNTINVQETNNIIYNNCRSLHDLSEFTTLLRNLGYEILEKQVIDFSFFIKAVKL